MDFRARDFQNFRQQNRNEDDKFCQQRKQIPPGSHSLAGVGMTAKQDFACILRTPMGFVLIFPLAAFLRGGKSLHCLCMNLPAQPNVKLINGSDYRESYANSVQMRVNVWDFFMVFGTLQQQTESQVEIRNFQGIYLSPQQAKALLGLLQQNIVSYESAFGEIKLDPRLTPTGPVH
jgi:flagellar protein FlaG